MCLTHAGLAERSLSVCSWVCPVLNQAFRQRETVRQSVQDCSSTGCVQNALQLAKRTEPTTGRSATLDSDRTPQQGCNAAEVFHLECQLIQLPARLLPVGCGPFPPLPYHGPDSGIKGRLVQGPQGHLHTRVIAELNHTDLRQAEINMRHTESGQL